MCCAIHLYITFSIPHPQKIVFKLISKMCAVKKRYLDFHNKFNFTGCSRAEKELVL